MRIQVLRWIVIGLLIALGAPALAKTGDCSTLEPPPMASGLLKRDVVARDLVRLRDIGPTAGMFLGGSPIGVSPDGGRIAFQLRRGDPESNSFCLAMFVMDLNGKASPRVVDKGGELIRVSFSRGPLAGYPSGEAKLITPKWSLDGTSVAFLKKVQGIVQVWAARADGSGSKPLTSSQTDVEDFAWRPSGTSIIIATRPALIAARRAIEAEGRGGYLYDERWSPIASNHP